jgi:hypothetical protein
MATLGMTLTCTCATVTVAEAERVGSAADTAVTLTVAGVGMVAGAVYSPRLEIVPTVELPPAIPLTLQLTAVFDPALTTVAVKDCVPVPASTTALLGATDTATGGVMVTPAKPVLVASASDTAFTDTVGDDGTFTGAEYKPAVVMVPTVALPPATPLTSQLTAVFAVLVTAAVKACVPGPACTAVPLGDTVTVIGSDGVMGVKQAALPALAGAVVEAAVALTTAWALSVRPPSSVTVTCSVKLPLLGATTVTVGPLADPTMLPIALPLMTDQA